MSASEARAERLASGPVCPKCGCLGRGKTPPKPSQAELRARLEEKTATDPEPGEDRKAWDFVEPDLLALNREIASRMAERAGP